MPWQPDGTFLRINPDYTGNVWDKDQKADIKVIATRHDFHDQDLADGIARCLNIDGYNKMFADLDMNNYKIINAAHEAGVEFRDHARRMEAVFFEGMDALGNRRPSVSPRATEHIPQIHSIISTLIEKGHAYPSGGDVYFRVRSHDSYLDLSGRSLEDMQACRVAIDGDTPVPAISP